MAFYALEPWGDERENFRAGLVAAAVYNRHRDGKKERKPYRPEDFMPRLVEKAEPEVLLEKIQHITAALGG